MTFIDGTRFSRVMSVFRGGNDYSIAFADDLVNEVYIAMFTVTGSSASVENGRFISKPIFFRFFLSKQSKINKFDWRLHVWFIQNLKDI